MRKTNKRGRVKKIKFAEDKVIPVGDLITSLDGKPLWLAVHVRELAEMRELFRYRAERRGVTPTPEEIDAALWLAFATRHWHRLDPGAYGQRRVAHARSFDCWIAGGGRNGSGQSDSYRFQDHR